jgi:mannose-1-phosphate guanylyltransferase
MNNSYLMILCGGRGERLWPLARPDRPKQFIPWHNNETLFDATLKRLAPLRAHGAELGVITNQCYEHFFKNSCVPLQHIIAEPASRNTGPAMLYTALTLAKLNPEAVIAFVPADHYVANDADFQQQLMIAIQHAQTHDELVILGVQPTYPATGYGYIEASESTDQKLSSVLKFYEKPNHERAQRFIQNPHMLWNIGVYVGKASVFIAEAAQHAPALLEGVQEFLQYFIGYESLPAISFDYAVAEQSQVMSVLPCSFEWDDVGTLTKFVELMQKEAAAPNNIMHHEAHNNTVLSTKKNIALISVDNLTIIETEDTLLVMQKEAAESVRIIAHKIQEQKIT